MKILSDFDGVLTDQTEEAERVDEIFKSYLREIADTSTLERKLEQELADFSRKMLNEPQKFGWKVSGRISAFSDEDLFIKVNAMGAGLDDEAQSPESVFAVLKPRVSKWNVSDFAQLANVAYRAMVEETKKGKIKPLDPKAVQLVEKILDRGIEFVVVSNSSTERIFDLFKKAGLHEKYMTDTGNDSKCLFRIRGDASKFDLGNSPELKVQVQGHWVFVDRPKYEVIIREEKPDMVIGDVFSLDLALPLYLSQKEPETFGGIRLLLRTRPYTPGWILKQPGLEHLNPFEELGEKIGLH